MARRLRSVLLPALLAAVRPAVPAEPSAAAIHETFGPGFDGKRFTTPIPNKNTEVRDGVLWTHGASGGKYPPMVCLPVQGTNLTVSFRYRHLGDGGWLWFFVDGDDGFGGVDHMLRVKLLRDAVQLQVDGHSRDANHPQRQKTTRPADPVSGAYRLNEFLPAEKVDLSHSEWREVRIVFQGEGVTVSLTGQEWTKTLSRPCFHAAKRKLLWMQNGGEKGIEIDDIRVGAVMQPGGAAAATRRTEALASGKDLAAEPYRPLVWRGDAEWYGSAFWTGPDWTRVGKDWHHPGNGTPSVRRFECPRDGRVSVTGCVFKLHLSGDGIRATIRHNGRDVWTAEIGGTDGTGAVHRVELDVKKGDAIRFVVHKRGNIGCDTTGWDPAVAYEGGAPSRASAGFGAKRQGGGGWFYEQEGEGAAAPSVPAVARARPVLPVSPALATLLKAKAGELAPATEPALLEMALEEWWREDGLDGTAGAYRAAAANHLARARAVAADLGRALPPGFGQLAAASPASDDDLCLHYLRVRALKREIMVGQPRMDFGELLVCKRRMPSYAHLVAQYYGWRQRAGGGLFAVARPGRSLAVRPLTGGLPQGSCLEPRLHPDGRRILFAFVACDLTTPEPTSLPVNEAGPDERYYHLFEVGADGTGLRQLTRGPFDDMMADYLPDGGIVFCSTRRKGYSRCFGPQFSPRWDTYTLHRADGDGTNIRTLSWNDVSEWFPAVGHAGEILFARWDYIDRDAVTHQNLWSCRPDGTNPMAVWGNGLPKPHCTFQARPVPGSHKLVFVASAHHSITAGPVCLLDPAVGLNAPEAVERVTPLPYPEAEGWELPEWYESPWPLSEDWFLAAYSPERLRSEGQHTSDPNPDDALRICLLDRRGNRELIYRDPGIGTTTPIPLAPRASPPAVASVLPVDPPPHGEMTIYDVYRGLDGVPRGSIAEIRIVQIFPKTTPVANAPRMGLAGEENGRAILGTVPVEADGSARFLLPARTKVLFQAVDRDGFVRRTMRSSTYVQPGEVTSCVGCHEYGTTLPAAAGGMPMALRRAPSAIGAGPLGGRPFGFVEVVQPVLDRHCVRCHSGEKPKGGLDLTRTPDRGFTKSYLSLCGDTAGTWSERRARPELDANDLVPRYWQRNQIQVTPSDDLRAARQSRLVRMLTVPPGHQGVKLPAGDLRRLAAWIDLNAIFYGVYDAPSQARQLAGEQVPMPEIR